MRVKRWKDDENNDKTNYSLFELRMLNFHGSLLPDHQKSNYFLPLPLPLPFQEEIEKEKESSLIFSNFFKDF